MKVKTTILLGLAITMLGCRSEKEATTEDSGAWWETEEGGEYSEGDEGDGDKPEESGDGGDKPEDGSGYSDCPEDFDPSATCEGSWEETICMYDGMIWWCDAGVWLNEEDK